MKLTATAFRKELFPLLERSLRGETIEVVYKGRAVKLLAGQPVSKLARAKRQHALLCKPEAIVHSDRALLAKMESEWRKDWDEV